MRRATRAHVVTCILFGVVSAPEVAAAQDGGLQLEGHVLPQPGLRVGLRLGERAVVLTGVNASFSELDFGDANDHMGMWSIPLEAKLYLADAVPGAVVPLVALGGSYGRNTRRLDFGSIGGLAHQELAANMVTAYWLGGVSYVVTAALSLELAALAHYYTTWSDDDPAVGLGGLGGLASPNETARGWGISWRFGVVIRP